MKSQIQKINENDVNGYENLVKFTEKIFNKGFSELSDVPFDKPLFMMKHIPSLFGLRSYKSVYSLVSSYIKNEKLRRMLSMHPLLVGGNPFTTTSIYGLILFLEKKWGIHYSMGGTGNIIKGLEKLMLEENIKILKGSEVTKINLEKGKIKSVNLKNQNEIQADNVICNADPPAVYETLLSNQRTNLMFDWKKKEWNILWVYLFTILEQKKYIKILLTIQ